MRKGGSSRKGSAFERAVGRDLSRWISGGQRNDLFARNVLSGGDFTRRLKSGEGATTMPGDLMARSPLANDFMSSFLVECKHYRDLGLKSFLLDLRGNSFLARTITLAQTQAAASGLSWMVVAKQNNVPTLLIVGRPVAPLIMCGSPAQIEHWLHGGEFYMTLFNDFLERVDPVAFISAVVRAKTIMPRKSR